MAQPVLLQLWELLLGQALGPEQPAPRWYLPATGLLPRQRSRLLQPVEPHAMALLIIALVPEFLAVRELWLQVR